MYTPEKSSSNERPSHSSSSKGPFIGAVSPEQHEAAASSAFGKRCCANGMHRKKPKIEARIKLREVGRP